MAQFVGNIQNRQFRDRKNSVLAWDKIWLWEFTLFKDYGIWGMMEMSKIHL